MDIDLEKFFDRVDHDRPPMAVGDTDRGQVPAEADREIPTGRDARGGTGRSTGKGHAPRRSTVAPAVQHRSGRTGRGTGVPRPPPCPLCGRPDRHGQRRGIGQAGAIEPHRVHRAAITAKSGHGEEQDRQARGTELSWSQHPERREAGAEQGQRAAPESEAEATDPTQPGHRPGAVGPGTQPHPSGMAQLPQARPDASQASGGKRLAEPQDTLLSAQAMRAGTDNGQIPIPLGSAMEQVLGHGRKPQGLVQAIDGPCRPRGHEPQMVQGHGSVRPDR